MKYAVDRIENDIVVLENIDNNDIKKVSIKDLPYGIKESDILEFKEDIYQLDNNVKEDRLTRIQEKFNNLRK